MRRHTSWNDVPFDQNVGAVLGAEGVLVIDTRASRRLAEELRRELAALTRQPVAAVVNTHHHWDHTWGNASFEPAPIWGHVRCADRVLSDSEEARDRLLEGHPDLADELREVVFAPPNRTFTESASVDLGDRRVELRYLGRGHTDNDVVALVPDAGVLFAGDLLENDAPPSFGDSFPLAWAETVASRLLPLINEVVVPGHGACGGVDFAERQAAELGRLAGLIRGSLAGAMEIGDVLAGSPFTADATRTALERGHSEVESDASDVAQA